MPPRTRSSARARAQPDPEEARGPPTLPTSSDHDGVTSSPEDSEPETSKPRPTKRTRGDFEDSETPTQPMIKRVRGKHGKLKGVMNMPIEVFTEIAKYLYPLDLILLSRANKFFRQLLMCRSATQTWRYALSNVPDLPTCPQELCEPQYAALVFSKCCSMCGKQALRPMDPILQVRLCVSCRDQEVCSLGNGEYAAVPTSTAILPQKGRYRDSYCLRKDLYAYRTEYNAVRQADGQNAAYRWEQEQRTRVRARWQNAQPLVKFIKKMEEEQSDDLATRKEQRQEEVESRLLKLGWEDSDFEMREKAGAKQWKSLVCIAKPLTERDWDKILPQLTPLLEQNRKLRLEAEASIRLSTRQSKVMQWLSKTFHEMEPYARLLDNAQNEFVSQAQEDLYSMLRYTEESKRASKYLKAPYPVISEAIAWDALKLLVDTDIPMEDFELKLVDIRPTLDTLLLEWRVQLEESLIELLPTKMDSTEANSENASSSSGVEATMVSSQVQGSYMQTTGEPVDAVSSGTQSLLRADTVFCQTTYHSGIYFYPDDFTHLWSVVSEKTWCYNVEASNIAKALLLSLGNIDETHLQMKAAGPGFSCGRCVSRNCVTWREMVSHFVSEKARWDFFRKQSAYKKGKLTYIFTHDVETTQDVNATVRIANEDDMKTPYRQGFGRFGCDICAPFRSIGFESADGLEDHRRNV
ncbi:hypothetical protein FRC09_020459 [Ceratobasidium sp. 395]|nr:hypothetical protein FRC09_020459 [Ceratobasidium sp. 395]